MTDSHTHLTEEPLFSNLEEFIKNFTETGGESLLNISHNPESLVKVLEISKKYSNYPGFNLKSGIGLHPNYFNEHAHYDFTAHTYERATKALKQLEKDFEMHHKKLDAVGETGLDYYQLLHDENISTETRERTIELQKKAFRKHIELAQKYKLPLTIHVRDQMGSSACIKDAISVLSEFEVGSVSGSFHSYTGPVEYVEDILNTGFYIGFNGIITYGSADNVREILREAPIEKVLLETDAPYLPPEQVRSNKKLSYRKGQPSDVRYIAEKITEIKSISKQEILDTTTRNYYTLFGA
jgi:TatD DNase family protein